MGDHPIHSKARMEWADLNSHFNADDAYLLVDDKSYELYPFMVIQHCAKHDRDEICFLDKIMGEGVRHLSFEDREEHLSQDGAEDIYDWFASAQVTVETWGNIRANLRRSCATFHSLLWARK